MRVLLLAAVVAAAGLAAAAHWRGAPAPIDGPEWTDRWDAAFRQQSRRRFGPAWDWRWWKAQAAAESSLRPDAVSPAGAAGLMQIMPSTFADIARRIAVTDRFDARHSIAAGIWYDRWLWDRLPDKRGRNRLAFTLAGYNAGPGAIAAACRRAAECADWAAAAPHAPEETQRYVARVFALMGNRF